MRAVIAAVALAQDSRMLFSTGARLPATSSQAQVVAVYDDMVPQFAQPVVYAQPAEAQTTLDLSWVLPSVAVLAVGAAAGAYAASASGAPPSPPEDTATEPDLEAALDAAQALALAGPLNSPVAMLFSGGKKAGAPKKAAPKKAAPKKAAARPKAAAKKPAPKAKPAPKRVAGTYAPNLQPAPWSPFKDLFSLSLVGGGQGNTLASGGAPKRGRR